VKRPYELWSYAGDTKAKPNKPEAYSILTLRPNTFVDLKRHCAKHKSISHPFIFYGVDCPKLTTVFREMDIAL
jgi:hypothetical protein